MCLPVGYVLISESVTFFRLLYVYIHTYYYYYFYYLWFQNTFHIT
jgi:hypothetical protein